MKVSSLKTTIMKKHLIAALVGGLIIFFWSFLSWTALNLHKSQTAYLDNQAEILDCLEGKMEEGFYFIPQVKPGGGMEEHEAYTKQMTGKPWAQVYYHNAFEVNPGMNMFRGFLMAFISVFLLVFILDKIHDINFKDVFLSALSVGLIGYLTGKYSEGIWFELNTIPDLIDTLVVWSLVGAWLGWWLTRKKAA